MINLVKEYLLGTISNYKSPPMPPSIVPHLLYKVPPRHSSRLIDMQFFDPAPYS